MKNSTSPKLNPAQILLSAPIHLYKRFISPCLGPHCRFTPTCSTYALQAIATHGAIKGMVLALWRIARCNPLGGYGFDPVPPKGSFRLPPYRSGRKSRP